LITLAFLVSEQRNNSAKTAKEQRDNSGLNSAVTAEYQRGDQRHFRNSSAILGFGYENI
jgi:hypothetical protein